MVAAAGWENDGAAGHFQLVQVQLHVALGML